MAPVQVTLGRPIISDPDDDYAVLSAGNMRVGIFDGPSSNVLVTHIYTRMGKGGATNTVARNVLYDAEGGVDELLGYTGLLSLTIQMASAAGGANIGGPVAVSRNGYDNAFVVLKAGRDWAVGPAAPSLSINHGMQQASRPDTSGNKNFYTRSYPGLPPEDYGSVTGVYEGNISSWVTGWTNEAPRVPVGRSVLGSSGGVVGDTTPTFHADFRDRNGVWGTANGGFNVGDVSSKARYRFRWASSGVIFHSVTYNTSTAEKNGDYTEYTYNGPAIPIGSEIEWAVTHWDIAGEASAESDWLPLTIASAGAVASVGAGSIGGKITTLTPTLSARYTHGQDVAGVSARVHVRQGSVSGTIVHQSGEIDIPDITPSASPGTLFSITWATLGFSDLLWETSYYFGVQIKDNNGVWTNYAYSGRVTTNQAPTTPSEVFPGDETITTLPVNISFSLSDPDDATADLAGRVAVEGEYVLANPDFTTDVSGWTAEAPAGFTRTLTRDAAQGKTALGSAKMDVTANSTTNQHLLAYTNTQYRCVPGETYTAFGWVRTSNANIIPRLAFHWYASGGAYLSTSIATHTAIAINSWVNRSFSAAAPATAAFFQIAVAAYFSGASVTGAFWFDDIDVSPGIQVIVDATHDAITDLHEVDLTATELNAVQPWTIYAYGYDGILYSGGAVVEADAERSVPITLNYITGPSVAITSHSAGATITTVRPTITFDAPTAIRRNVEVFDQDTGILLRRSGWQVMSGLSSPYTYRPSAGYIHDGHTLIFKVTVEDINLIQASTQVNGIIVAIPPPPSLDGVTLNPVAANNEPEATMLEMRWNETTVTENWRKYLVYIEGLEHPVGVLTSQELTEFVYAHPKTREDYTIGVSQVIEVDNENGVGEEVESPIVWQTAMVDFQGLILNDARDPLGVRFYSQAWVSRDVERSGRPDSEYTTWEQEAPFTVRSGGKWNIWSFVVPLADTETTSAGDQEALLNALHVKGAPLCYRDGYGRRDFVNMPTLGGLKISDGRSGFRTATCRARTEHFEEGVEDQL